MCSQQTLKRRELANINLLEKGVVVLLATCSTEQVNGQYSVPNYRENFSTPSIKHQTWEIVSLVGVKRVETRKCANHAGGTASLVV